MFDKLFGRGKKKEDAPAPAIPFGRYSDNNKTLAKTNRWTDSDNLFKEKKVGESLDAFFDYLRDENAGNVVYQRNGNSGEFHLYQGSKIVRGRFDEKLLRAEVTLARMPQPSVPVMRRLLEMNFNLYYSRFALDNDRLCMGFDTETDSASPSKLYYGLKELATKADKQDDLLVGDFNALQTIDTEHITPVPDAEKEIKYKYMMIWIGQVLDTIAGLDADKFSGANSYLLLSLVYRLDYLIAPEGKLMSELENISLIYFRKDERSLVEKNRDMIEEFKKLQTRTREDIFPHLFRSKYTFAIVAPQQYKTIADSIHGSNQNMVWYRDNNYPFIATQVAEYGISYCQYSYSMPRVITELFHLYMMVNYADYFTELGYPRYYDPAKNEFDAGAITEKIKAIQAPWKDKYPNLNFNTANLKFDNMVNFDIAFTNELEILNTEPK